MTRQDFFGGGKASRQRGLDLTLVKLVRCAGYSLLALRTIKADDHRRTMSLAACLRVSPEGGQSCIMGARGALGGYRLRAAPPTPFRVRNSLKHLLEEGARVYLEAQHGRD